MRIAVVYGTRPEAVKLAPLIPLLENPTVIFTGQHATLAEGLLEPTIDLQCPSTNDPVQYAKHLISQIAVHVKGMDLVVVQGDTASAWAGAQAGYERRVPVAHVEAGIRSGNDTDPWPEEGFRRHIDWLATYCFCATEANAANLAREYMAVNRQVHVVGNTGIDALYARVKPLAHPFVPANRVLVTLHRRESFGAPLTKIVQGLVEAAAKYPTIEFWWPVHPNPNIAPSLPCFTGNIHRLPPLPPDSFTRLLASSRAVLTDSGGVQEEAAALGIPCVIARNVTDRPESIESGNAVLAGTTSLGVLHGLTQALSYQLSSSPSLCFGDGHSAPRIAQLLVNHTVTSGIEKHTAHMSLGTQG